jgi:DNA modification methylase
MVVDALHQVGAARSIVIDENNVILAGNGVTEAAGEAGITKVRVVDVAGDELVAVRRVGLTDEQKRRLAMYDNRAGELASWDAEQLQSDAASGLDLKPWFSDEELAKLTGVAAALREGLSDPDTVPESRATGIKVGDLFNLGNHLLLCGNSTSPADVTRLMNGQTPDVLLTDPPYGMHLDTDWSDVVGRLTSKSRQHQTRGNKYDRVVGDDAPFDPAHLFVVFSNCREMFLWGADYYAESIPNRADGSWLVWDKRKESQADAIGAEFELCWSKAKHKRRMLRHDWFGFLSSQNGSDARNRVHPTQKPVSLMVDILQQWGKDDDTVVDTYAGSGSTLIACEQTGRICHALELLPSYVQVIIDRWEAFTGQKAVKVGEAVSA